MIFLRVFVFSFVVCVLVYGTVHIWMFVSQNRKTHIIPNTHRDPTLCSWFGENGFVFVHKDCFPSSIPTKQKIHLCQSTDENNTCYWGRFVTHEPVDTHIKLTTLDTWSGSRLLQYAKQHSLTVSLNTCTFNTHTMPCKNWIRIGTQTPDLHTKKNH